METTDRKERSVSQFSFLFEGKAPTVYRKIFVVLTQIFSLGGITFLFFVFKGEAPTVNIISSDYCCCDPDIHPWGYHQRLVHCCEYYIGDGNASICEKMLVNSGQEF